MAETAPYRAMYAYVWDLVEEDPDAFTDAMKEIGVNTVAIAAAYHAGKFIRPKGKSGKVYFPEDGVAHCRVKPGKYGGIKPQIGALAQQDDVMGRMCARGDIAVSAWTVLLHNSRIGAEHPDSITRNVYGDPLHYSLCPSAPEVREYATTLCADIADSYDITGLSLETPGWLPYKHGYHHEFALIGDAPRLEFYLGLCFCANCKRFAQDAGLDVEGLAKRVRARIEAELSAPEETAAATDRLWLENELLLDPDLGAYIRWRTGVVTSLVGEIREAVRKDATVHIIPSVNQPLALAWMEGSDLAGIDAACDGLEVCFYSAAALTDHALVSQQIGHSDTRVVLRPTSAEHRSEASFAATVTGFAEAGVSGFAFYNYGHMRQSGLDRIGRALAAI